jgi:hypothetical protein
MEGRAQTSRTVLDVRFLVCAMSRQAAVTITEPAPMITGLLHWAILFGEYRGDLQS